MNTPSPLVPQGTMPTGKSTLRVAVFTILVLHVALIGGFLFQGCSKKENKPMEEISTTTVDTNMTDLSSNTVIQPFNGSNAPVATTSNTAVEVAPLQPVTAPAYVAPVAPVAAIATGSEYSVVAGDTLASIAKKHGVSLKALEAANPGVDSKKLKLKQKLQIPGGSTVSAVATTGAAVSEAGVASEGTTYTVKPGDALAKIAKNHGVSVNAIVALNNLKSKNSIKPGQKLKMPAPKTVVAAAPAAVEASAVTTPAVVR